MSSPFFGLNIGASALRTAQTLVDITNQNIANANTPGYSRQAAKISATTPFPVPAFNATAGPGQLGTGVQVTEITRARDTFIDYQMHNQLNTQAQVDARGAALTQVEATVNEPSTTGLNSTLTKYWNAWQEVANSPADSSIRANLVEQGKAVADAFQSQVSQFSQQQRDLDQQVGLTVTNVNTLSTQIAAVNLQVAKVEASGMHANDLRDQRDLLVDSLSKLVKINVVESPDGQLNINVGSHQLVDRSTAHPMLANAAAGAFTQVQWIAGSPATLTGTSPASAISGTGTLTINTIPVTLTAGRTPVQTVDAINTTAGLGAGGAVVASLDSAGALVLTSTAPGKSGSVTVSGSPGSISTDLALVSTTVTGTGDGTPVDLGGGQLQGLIESRDQLLQERIDGVNALAGRVIESVNSLSASGTGLDGVSGRNFFAGTNASTISVDPQLTAVGGTDKVAASRLVADPASASGYSSAAGDSSNAVAMAELANVVTERSPLVGDVAPGPIGTALAPVSLVGIDLSGADANTTYKFTVVPGTPPTLTATPPGTGSATVTVGTDSTGGAIFTVDTGTSRLTLSAPAGTTVAQALAGLDGKTVTTNAGPSTIADEYGRQIAALGVESQTAQNQSINQGVLINQLDTQRKSTSGVSLDEETINLISYQKAYQAAARVVTVVDEMLDTLINHTGVL